MNKTDTWKKLKTKVQSCTSCPLHETRQNAVFGEGNEKADILIIGEGPGAKEDELGRPFVGRAGKLLDQLLEEEGLSREKNVFIANIVKCRPPKNRIPHKQEIETCFPYLEKQIEYLNPGVIVLLGLTAYKSFTGEVVKMGETHGKWFDYKGHKMMTTYHPASVFRNPSFRKFIKEDFKKIVSMIKK
jgi:DNA polymerase